MGFAHHELLYFFFIISFRCQDYCVLKNGSSKIQRASFSRESFRSRLLFFSSFKLLTY